MKNRLINQSIENIEEIRIVVLNGRGFGNQKAAITLMQRLRELGFNGTFDVRYFPGCTERLETLIPEFKASQKHTVNVESKSLGKLNLTSLSDNKEEYQLPFALITMVGADDFGDSFLEKKCEEYNTAYYVGAKPTDFHLGNYAVICKDESKGICLDDCDPRLSVASQSHINNINMTANETRILALAKDNRVLTQLVYGLYPRYEREPFSNRQIRTGSLGEEEILKRIIKAENEIAKQYNKPLVLLLPQDIPLLFMDLQRKDNDEQIYFLDLTKNLFDVKNYKPGDIIIAHTGKLSAEVFDLILSLDNLLPPIIEGCNAREVCESTGRAFISPRNIKTYPLALENVQSMHLDACLYLTLESITDQNSTAFTQYISSYLLPDQNQISAYHMQRKERFLERPNICDLALTLFGIGCKNISKNIFLTCEKLKSNFEISRKHSHLKPSGKVPLSKFHKPLLFFPEHKKSQLDSEFFRESLEALCGFSAGSVISIKKEGFGFFIQFDTKEHREIAVKKMEEISGHKCFVLGDSENRIHLFDSHFESVRMFMDSKKLNVITPSTVFSPRNEHS